MENIFVVGNITQKLLWWILMKFPRSVCIWSRNNWWNVSVDPTWSKSSSSQAAPRTQQPRISASCQKSAASARTHLFVPLRDTPKVIIRVIIIIMFRVKHILAYQKILGCYLHFHLIFPTEVSVLLSSHWCQVNVQQLLFPSLTANLIAFDFKAAAYAFYLCVSWWLVVRDAENNSLNQN